MDEPRLLFTSKKFIFIAVVDNQGSGRLRIFVMSIDWISVEHIPYV